MKTKTFKRLAAAAAALVMMSAVPMMSMPNVFAANPTYSVTIKADQDSKTHSYVAYRIFSADYDSTSGKLSNIKWDDTVINKTGFLTALSNSTILKTDTNQDFATTNTIDDIITKLGTYNDNDEKLAEFAKLAKNNIISGAPLVSFTNGSANLEGGYYLIEDTNANGGNALSRFMLQVSGTTNITPKVVYPIIDKKIGTTIANGVDYNTATIGDIIPYVISATIPDMTGYNQYFYVVNDTLSTGLTYYDSDSSDNDKELIAGIDKNGNGTLEADEKMTDGTDYVATISGNSVKVAFNNFISHKNYTGKNVIITYRAELNANASISTNGANANKNTVKLTYSNNPNVDNKGDASHPEEPDSNTPTNDTTPKTVVTYTSQLKILKIDGANQTPDTPLQGAGFTVYDESGNTAVTAQALSDADGYVLFKGLGAGKYILRETQTPAGYNTAPDYKFEIKADSINTTSCTWGKDDNCDNIFSVDSTLTNEGGFYAEITNNAGATLPSTGGIGTTIFYVSGGTLIVGAVVVLITKKRMSLKDDK